MEEGRSMRAVHDEEGEVYVGGGDVHVGGGEVHVGGGEVHVGLEEVHVGGGGSLLMGRGSC